MPYSITKGGGSCKSSEWAVIKDDDGKTMGCHATKKEAEDQIAAIYANEGNKMTTPHSHLAKVRLASPERLKQLRELLPNESENNLFFWDAEISNDLIDSYFTHMSEKTLRNYAADAQRGVAFLKGHDWKSLPIGYSLSGEYDVSEGRKRVLAGFYTIRGLEDTDGLIARMEARILRDVSVGFFGGSTTCDICGRDMWDWDCRHMPGLTYEEKKDDVTRSILSTFTIDDARLSEVSGVFDGSTPEAMIRKAEVLARAGDLSPQQAHILENRYRIALPLSASFPSVVIPATRETKMTEEELVQVRKQLGVVIDADVPAAIDDLQTALDDARSRIKSLELQAKEGEQYRKDLIEAALLEGVRAYGNDFDRSLYEETLQSAPLPVVKRMRDDWKKTADQLLPSSRKSEDGEKKDVRRVAVHPDSAYAG